MIKRLCLLLSGLIVIGFGILFVVTRFPAPDEKPVMNQFHFKKPRGYSSEIAPYVNYLKSIPNRNPVDYVIKLFDKYDLVILGERNHADITQYELIYKIVSDKRFIEKSGLVFTEIGTQSINDRLNQFLQTKGLKTSEVEQQLIPLYRDLTGFQVYWEKYNLFDFLKKVYLLNTTLPDQRKIRIQCADFPIDWDHMTPERYQQEITDRLGLRDKIMADFIVRKYQEVIKNQSRRKKALVIMNSRHSFKKNLGVGFDPNATVYINEAFKGKVANVMMNTVRDLPGTNDQESVSAPIQKGKWDAAFRYIHYENAAFDFRDTPFGKDRFDSFDQAPHEEYTYQDIFDGFIFYYPLEKHVLVWNVPGFADLQYLPTLIQRMKYLHPDIPDITSLSKEQIDQAIKDMNHQRLEPYPDILNYNQAIEQWLKY